MSATTKADGRTLPWRILRRTVKPYALAVSLSTFIVSYAIIAGHAIGQLLNEFPGQLVGVAGFAAVMLLWVGWWCQRTRCFAVRGVLPPRKQRLCPR